MNTLLKSGKFEKWLRNLKDPKTRFRVIARLQRAENGNFGDVKELDDKIFEMRLMGQGLRIYYIREGNTVYFLLAGGDKTGQEHDIALARKLARERREK